MFQYKNIIDRDESNINMLCIYIFVFSVVLIPNIRILNLPAFRVDQVMLFLCLFWIVAIFSAGEKVFISNSGFFRLYSFFSFFILLSIWVGSMNGINPILNDFFEAYKIFVFLGTYLLFSSVVNSEKKRINVLTFLLVCLLLSTIVAMQQYFNWFGLNESYVPYIAPTQYFTLVDNYPFPRVVGMTGNPNEYSAMPGIGIILAIALFLKTKKKRYLLSIIIFFITLIITLSRTGLVFLIVALLVFAFLYFHWSDNKTKINKLLQIVSISGLLFFSGALLLNYLPDTITWRFSLSQTHTFELRIIHWEEHLHYFKTSPIFGLGPAKSVIYDHAVDNEWLLLLRRYGIVGCVYIVIVFVLPFIRLKDVFYKQIYFSILCGVAVYMIPAAFYHSFQLMPILMIIAGLIPINSKKRTAIYNNGK